MWCQSPQIINKWTWELSIPKLSQHSDYPTCWDQDSCKITKFKIVQTEIPSRPQKVKLWRHWLFEFGKRTSWDCNWAKLEYDQDKCWKKSNFHTIPKYANSKWWLQQLQESRVRKAGQITDICNMFLWYVDCSNIR